MFRRVLNTTVRATLTLFLRDFFENVSSQNFEDLRVGSSIHVILSNLAIKRTISDQLLKNAPFKLLHAGIDRLQAELTLNTKQARKLLLQEVHAVLEFDPDWIPPPPSNDAPPPIPSGISGAAAIVYSSNTGEVLEDSFLRDDMKAILSKRNVNEEEAIKMPDDDVDRSASAVAALLKELVHHSEVAIDGFTVRIRFPPSKKQREEAEQVNRPIPTTNEILIRFPSIFVRDKTVFDGKPSDQFFKFVSIAPPIIQVYALSPEDLSRSVSSTERQLNYEDTLAMGYGFLFASAEMERLRDETLEKSQKEKEKLSSSTSTTSNNDDSKNNNNSNENQEKVEGMDFHTLMESQRCVTIEVVRRTLQPRVPTWDVKISTTPFLICARPYQIGLLLDIGHRLSAQTKLQEEVEKQREMEVAEEDEEDEEEKFVQRSNRNFSSSFAAAAAANQRKKSGKNQSYSSGTSAPGTTLSISAKCQHGVIALFTSDEVEPIRECWESIEDYGSFIEAGYLESSENNNNNSNNIKNRFRDEDENNLDFKNRRQNNIPTCGNPNDTSAHLPKCLSKQRGYFALSAGSGRFSIEKNNTKNSLITKSSSSASVAAGSGDVTSSSSNNNNSTLLASSIYGESEMERFLDRYTETTISASLGSLVFVERASLDTERGDDAVKVIEIASSSDKQQYENVKNNNNNTNTSSNSNYSVAGKITVKITEAVPFHDVLKYSSSINLSGVRHRHPTTNEAFSEALLRSTVTIRNISLVANGRTVIRIEPTVLGRVVDFMNFMNSEVISKAMIRNGIPLPKLPTQQSNNNSSSNSTGEENQQQQQDELRTSSSQQDKNNSSNEIRNEEQPFDDEATTISASVNEVDLQCLLLKNRMPAPDIWGPLTCRLFDHLAKNNNNEKEQQQEQLEEQKSPLLPRSFIIRGKELNFSASPGTEPTIAKLSITSAEALIQQEASAASSSSSSVGPGIRALLRISPTERVPNFSLRAAVKSVPFGVSDVTKLDKIAKEVAQRPTMDQSPLLEKLAKELSSISVDIQIPRVHGVTDFLMDDFIFVLFAATEMSEVSLPLVRYVPLDETAASVAAKSFVPNSVVSVNLMLQDIQLFIGAPRLDRHGVCLGEPLSSLLPPEDTPRNLTFALHRYEVRASQLSLTLGIAAITQLTQHWGMALGLGNLSLREHLIQLDGHPGAVHLLVDSFAEAHRRSYEREADARRGRSGRVFNMVLIRDTCLRKRSDLMQIGIVVECVSLIQQASWEGDNWPAVLAFWSADTPTHVKAGERVHAGGSVQKTDVVPLSAAISVNVTARDILLDWKAEIRKERLAVLVSALEVEIPELVTGDPKLTAIVRILEPAALLLHNDFPTPIIEFDRAMFVSGVNIFGSTRKGALEDLQYLGFAQLCTIGPRKIVVANTSSALKANTSNIPTIVVRKSHPGSNRKLQVEIHHFFTEFSFAPDSCALFIAFIEHIQDAKYVRQCVTSPVRLTRRAGGHYSLVTPSIQQVEEFAPRAFVQDFDFMDELQHYRRATSSGGVGNVSASALSNKNRNNLMNNNNSNSNNSIDPNISDWDLPELDESGREKANAFVIYENVINDFTEQQQQQQQQRQSRQNADEEEEEEEEEEKKERPSEAAKYQQQLQQKQQQKPTLTDLMSDLYYFQPPIFDESAIAEPLFNVPTNIEFELLLHSCDFKVSFFNGSDFELMKESSRGSSRQKHRDPNNNNNNNNAGMMLMDGFSSGSDDDDDNSEESKNISEEEQETKSSTLISAGLSSFHSMSATIPIFDVAQRRQRRRRARNSSECIALWLNRCFTQVDIFPNKNSNNDNEDEEVVSISTDDRGQKTVTSTNNNSIKQQQQQRKNNNSKKNDFVPIRQIIFRAGDIEVEDLVHESPVRKMLYCALPKSQRDAPVVTVRIRTLQKDANSSRSPVGSVAADLDMAKNNSNNTIMNNSKIYNNVINPMFQKLEAQQVSIRLLPLGVNISARTVMRVISAFVNMNKTKVALSNQQPLPSITSAVSSLASLAQGQHSGISGIRPLDSASRFLDPPGSPNASNSNYSRQQQSSWAGQRQESENSGITPDMIATPPTFFDKLIIHPLDLRVSWFPDETLYSDKQIAAVIGNQWLMYIVRYLAIEGARLSLSRISLSSVKMEDISERIVVEAWPQLKASKLLLLFAGLQPVRPAAEIAGALGDLVLTPLEYWQHQRSIFVGIARGLQTCTSRLAAESLTLSATGTRLGQHAALALTKGIQRNPTPMLWGNQPTSVSEGAVRALRSAEKGVLDFGAGVLFCVDEMKQSSVASGLARLPLSLLIPVEGVLRGMTEAILGVRNAIRPEERIRETQEFKSSVFSHKRVDDNDDDDDQDDGGQ